MGDVQVEIDVVISGVFVFFYSIGPSTFHLSTFLYRHHQLRNPKHLFLAQ